MSPPHNPDFSTTQQFKGLESAPESESGPDEVGSGWASLPLFSGMSGEAIAHFRDAMEEVIYTTGEDIILQGDEGEDMFVLESGTMRVTVTSGATKTFERTFESPHLFGEMALITREPRSATITAETKCYCLRINKTTVQELFKREPGIPRCSFFCKNMCMPRPCK